MLGAEAHQEAAWCSVRVQVAERRSCCKFDQLSVITLIQDVTLPTHNGCLLARSQSPCKCPSLSASKMQGSRQALQMAILGRASLACVQLAIMLAELTRLLLRDAEIRFLKVCRPTHVLDLAQA